MSNRARLHVALGASWRLYQQAAVPGWHMLGTVQRGHEVGALARNAATGNLAMFRAGGLSQLDQRKANAALDEASGQQK